MIPLLLQIVKALATLVLACGAFFLLFGLSRHLLPGLFWRGLGYCIRCDAAVPAAVIVCGECGYDPTERELATWRKHGGENLLKRC